MTDPMLMRGLDRSVCQAKETHEQHPRARRADLDLLRSAGEVLHPEPGELLWDTGDT
jgi:hypothetical protein